MKKFIAWLLVISCLFTLVACNKTKENTETTGEATEVQVTEEKEKLFFDESKYTVEKGEMERSEANPSYAMQTTSYKLKENYAGDLPYVIMVGSTNINFGTDKIKELTTQGWELVDGHKSDSMVKRHISTNTIIKDANDNCATVYAANSTDNEMVYSECMINKVVIYYDKSDVFYGKAQAADFNYKGITKSSSVEDVIETLSEPNYIYITDHYENNVCYKSVITLSYSKLDEHFNGMEFKLEFVDDKSTITISEISITHN